MKYYTTIFSLFFLSLVAAGLNLHFGSLNNKISKNNNNILTQIEDLNQRIKVNKLEFTYHTKSNYLNDLKKLYLFKDDDSVAKLNLISINDFKKIQMTNVLEISTK
tara:strand:+ start:80 stop:397 length:318 start_codon:yes stop_codon:yes gene_type:complete